MGFRKNKGGWPFRGRFFENHDFDFFQIKSSSSHKMHEKFLSLAQIVAQLNKLSNGAIGFTFRSFLTVI